MPTFVDFAGMNTLVSSSIDGNTLSSGKNTEIADIQSDELVGINIHRNGPYGYSSWKQLRASENPITRHHRASSTMTFVVQPGPIRNVLSNGEFRIRDRYSVLYSFTEPAITQKAYPLVWNVGRHTKDSNGKINMSKPQRFSIISSFENQKIGFANEDVDKQLKVNYANNETEYDEIYNLYADGGINGEDSPLTYWEFLQYRETVYPHMKNQFQKENLIRENFKSFYRHARTDRAETFLTNSFGFTGYHLTSNPPINLTHSTWPLDAADDFLTRNLDTDTADSLISENPDQSGVASNIVSNISDGGAGILQQNYSSFLSRNANTNPTLGTSAIVDLILTIQPGKWLSPLPVYSRPVTLINTQSVSNPCGMEIPETSSANYSTTRASYSVVSIFSGSNDSLVDPQVHSSWDGKVSKIIITESDGSTDEITVTWSLSGSSNTFTRNGAKDYTVKTDSYDVADFRTQFTNAVSDSIVQDDFGGIVSTTPIVSSFKTSFQFLVAGLTASAGQSIKFIPDNSSPSDEIVTNLVDGVLRRNALSGSGCYTFTGDAMWEAGSKREIKDENGNYISSPKNPFYDSYSDYSEELRRRSKNFSIIPEFRISPMISSYLENSEPPSNIFEITGASKNSSDQDTFYKTYSNSDFLRQFEIISKDHEEFTNAKVLSLRCKAIKKFLPYDGFYPAQRSVDLAEKFYDIYSTSISTEFDGSIVVQTTSTDNYGIQPIMKTLFAPGILFNTIKSGIAVDYPVADGTDDLITPTPSYNEFVYRDLFSSRIPFEAIVEPQKHLVGLKIRHPEPHPSGSFPFSAVLNGTSDVEYVEMANNFIAESINFFLPNGELTSISSRKQGEGINLTSGSVYAMRIKMNRSMTGDRVSVITGSDTRSRYFVPQDIPNGNYRETFTMYSRPSAFGLPTFGSNDFNAPPNIVETSRYDSQDTDVVVKDSRHGYNFPFTPPYYHGESWCDIILTASKDTYTIREIQEQASYTYTRFDFAHYKSTGASISTSTGAQAFENLNDQAVQLSSSLNILGISRDKEDLNNQIVESSLDSLNRWTIQTKFETPMLNFNHLSSSDISLPLYGSESVPRGIWHQYGRIPKEEEGVFMSVSKIPSEFQRFRMGLHSEMIDLSKILGFSGVQAKIGRIRSQKTISEAVVAVPFVEEEGTKRFFSLDKKMVDLYKEGGTLRQTLVTGDPDGQIGRSVLDQLQKMEKYVFPPSFDFINSSTDEVNPIAMYIFEFSHTLSQQDLSDIWQNLPPDIGTTMEESEVAITHPLLKKELLGPGGEKGNTTIGMHNKLKWMVFKVKQRAESNYFEKTVSRNPERKRTSGSKSLRIDEFGSTSNLQYNWPYDFFSLVELVKIDAEVELGNADFSNYTAHLPPWDPVVAGDREVVNLLSTPEVDDIDLSDYLGVPDFENLPSAPGDDMTPESGAGNAFIQERFEQLDDTIETVQDRIAERIAGSQGDDPQNRDNNEELDEGLENNIIDDIGDGLP